MVLFLFIIIITIFFKSSTIRYKTNINICSVVLPGVVVLLQIKKRREKIMLALVSTLNLFFIAFLVVQKFVDKMNSMNTEREKNIIATVDNHRTDVYVVVVCVIQMCHTHKIHLININ